MLPKKNRLTSKADFNLLLNKGKKWSGKYFLGFSKESSSSDPQIGFIISNKISKSAVSRNRIRRLLREAISESLSKIEKQKIVIVAKKEALGANFSQTKEEITSFLESFS